MTIKTYSSKYNALRGLAREGVEVDEEHLVRGDDGRWSYQPPAPMTGRTLELYQQQEPALFVGDADAPREFGSLQAVERQAVFIEHDPKVRHGFTASNVEILVDGKKLDVSGLQFASGVVDPFPENRAQRRWGIVGVIEPDVAGGEQLDHIAAISGAILNEVSVAYGIPVRMLRGETLGAERTQEHHWQFGCTHRSVFNWEGGRNTEQEHRLRKALEWLHEQCKFRRQRRINERHRKLVSGECHERSRNRHCGEVYRSEYASAVHSALDGEVMRYLHDGFVMRPSRSKYLRKLTKYLRRTWGDLV